METTILGLGFGVAAKELKLSYRNGYIEQIVGFPQYIGS